MAPQEPGTRTGFVILTLCFRKEGRLWTGQYLQLSTATDGRSLQQVRDELVELVELHLNELESVGERDRFFTENGITAFACFAATVGNPAANGRTDWPSGNGTQRTAENHDYSGHGEAAGTGDSRGYPEPAAKRDRSRRIAEVDRTPGVEVTSLISA